MKNNKEERVAQLKKISDAELRKELRISDKWTWNDDVRKGLKERFPACTTPGMLFCKSLELDGVALDKVNGDPDALIEFARRRNYSVHYKVLHDVRRAKEGKVSFDACRKDVQTTVLKVHEGVDRLKTVQDKKLLELACQVIEVDTGSDVRPTMVLLGLLEEKQS